MAEATTRKQRPNNRKVVERAQKALQLQHTNTNVVAIEWDIKIKTHAIARIIDEHWQAVHRACWNLAKYMPIQHSAEEVEALEKTIDEKIGEVSKLVTERRAQIDEIIANQGSLARPAHINAIEDKIQITSRLANKLFKVIDQADQLLAKASMLWLLDGMSDRQFKDFERVLNKRLRAVCTFLRQVEARMQNQLRAKRSSPEVQGIVDDLKKDGINLDKSDESENAEATAEAEPAEKDEKADVKNEKPKTVSRKKTSIAAE